jgi:phytoene synthase
MAGSRGHTSKSPPADCATLKCCTIPLTARGETGVTVQDYTRQKTKKSKTNFYYSFIFLPREKREAMYTVYSFCRHSDDIVDDRRGIDESRRDLENWRHELEACYQGHATHPIMQALVPVVQRFSIPKEYFHALIDGMEMDLSRKRYETFEELSRYCYHAASVVGLISIEIFGYRNGQAKEYAINLGKALQITNIMRDVAEDARNNRIYIPQEDLAACDYSETDLLNYTYSPAFVEVMKLQDQRARAFFEQAMQHFEKNDHHLLFPAEIMRKIYFQLLERISAAQYNVYQQRVRVPNWEKGRLALQTWLNSRWSIATQWVTTQS